MTYESLNAICMLLELVLVLGVFGIWFILGNTR